MSVGAALYAQARVGDAFVFEPMPIQTMHLPSLLDFNKHALDESFVCMSDYILVQCIWINPFQIRNAEKTASLGDKNMSEQASQRSLELFKSGYFCAESVLLALAENQGIHSDLIPKIATGFCSGISRTGGMCGAVSGAIMGINLTAGRNSTSESIEPSYTLTNKLISQFEREYGSVICRQLLGCDLATETGQQYFMENHLMECCLQYAEGATRIAISLIAE